MISKIVVQLSIGLMAAGAAFGGGITYVLSDNTAEYLTEVRWEKSEDSYLNVRNSENISYLTPNEIKGGKDKNYFCQWINAASKVEKDEWCKLINLDFHGSKFLNLAQMANMNNEIITSSEYFPEIWFKLKISKNYVFDINKTIKISIVDKDINSKIFTTIFPKFKISTSPIQGNFDWFLMKLEEWNPINLNIFNEQSYKCRWITQKKANEIVSSFKTSPSITTITNFESKYCRIDEFASNKQNPTTELDLSQQLSTKSQIKNINKGNYFIINSQEIKNNLITKSSSNLLIIFDENIDQDKNISFAIFTLESLLAVKFNDSEIQNADLIFLN